MKLVFSLVEKNYVANNCIACGTRVNFYNIHLQNVKVVAVNNNIKVI